MRLREVDEVPDDQEVVGEPHLLDRLELVLQPLLEIGRDGVVAALEPALAELDEIVERVAAFRHRELRQVDLPELDLDVAALRDLERAEHRRLVPGEIERHLLRRLEEEVVGVELPVVRVLQRVAGLDAQQRLVRARVRVAEVVDVTRRDRRQPRLAGELDELRKDARLHVEMRVLQLDVGVVAAEHLRQPVELVVGVAGAALLERLRNATGQAAGQRDQACLVPLEQLPVDARLVVVALEIAEARELDQVRVALVVAREEGQVRVALLLRLAVLGDVDLAADDRLHAGALRLLEELDRTGEAAVIRQGDGRHLELGRPLDEVRNAARSVENRVLGVDVQMDEIGLTHGRGDTVSPGPDRHSGRSRKVREEQSYTFVWGNNPRRAALKGRRCRVLARGRMGTVLVEFLDTGERVTTSHRAIRLERATPSTPPGV